MHVRRSSKFTASLDPEVHIGERYDRYLTEINTES